MTIEEKKKKLDEVWKEIFFLQKEAAKHNGVLCFVDKCRYNDLTQQMKKLHNEVNG